MPKTVLLLGGTGFVGQNLGVSLVRQGWKLRVVTRNPDRYQAALPFPCELFQWDGKNLDPEIVEGCEAVINMVGQPIADQAWNQRVRDAILDSRVASVKALCKVFEKVEQLPDVLLQFSAIGYYAGSGLDTVDEASPPGRGFLSEVCQQWEAELRKIPHSIRVVTLRLGVVIGWGGGAFAKIWNIYAPGLGGKLGHGGQWMNWVHLADVLGVVEFCLEDNSREGVVNLVAPGNCGNAEFHRELCTVTPSHAWTRVPSFVLKLGLGSRSDLVLEGQQVLSQNLDDYNWQYPSWQSALAELLQERDDCSCFYLVKRQWLPVPDQQLWEFVAEAGNLEKVTPPELNFRMVDCSTPTLGLGTRLTYRLKVRGLPMTWVSDITDWQPTRSFSDLQVKGPYGYWHHRHRFEALAGGTLAEDLVEYRLPLQPFSLVLHNFILADLEKIFHHRHCVLQTLMVPATSSGSA